MPIISSYPTVTPLGGDLLIVSDVSGTDNPTKTVTVQSVADLATPDTLEEVLATGNTAENSIILTGDTGNITISGDYTGTGINATGVISTTQSVSVGTTLGVTGLSTLATVDINGGNIDGTNVGASVQGTLDGTIGSNVPAVGTFTDLQSNVLKVDTNTLFVSNVTSRVGIGTTTAQSKLDVEGNVAIGVTYSGTSAAPTNGLIVEGDVGIGLANPTKKLHLYGASGEVELRIQSDVSFCSIVQKDNNEMIIQNAASGGVMIFHDDSAERMRIDTSGNVGIGITNPTTTLHVSGTTTITNELNLNASTPGSAGQLLASAGAGAVPTWANVADVGIQVQTTPIPTGEVGTLNSSPVVILPAPAAGIIRMPISFIIDWVVGTGAPATNTDVSIYQINNTEKIGTCAALLTASANHKIVIPVSQPGVPRRCTVGEATATTIQVDSGDPNMTGSNSSMTVYALYRDITL